MGPNEVLDKGFVVDSAVPWYYAVKQSDVEHVTVTTAAGDPVIGICQEEVDATDVARGRVVRVRVMGVSRGVADAAYPIGTRVRAAADGRLTALAATTPNQNQVGVLLTASSAADDWVDVLLTPFAHAGTA